jgi:hypothetical protein
MRSSTSLAKLWTLSIKVPRAHFPLLSYVDLGQSSTTGGGEAAGRTATAPQKARTPDRSLPKKHGSESVPERQGRRSSAPRSSGLWRRRRRKRLFADTPAPRSCGRAWWRIWRAKTRPPLNANGSSRSSASSNRSGRRDVCSKRAGYVFCSCGRRGPI